MSYGFRPLFQHHRYLRSTGPILLLMLLLLFPITSRAQSNLQLSISATSEPASSDVEDGSAGNARPVLIGEIITFNLSFEISEGTSTNVNLPAAIPDGLQYIAGSQSVSFSNDAGWSDTVGVSGGGSSGADISFDFGSVTNTDSDANLETIQIAFDVLVLNLAGNQSGDQLSTSATLNANGSLAATSEERRLTIVEPDLAMTKSVSLTYENAGLISTGSNDLTDAGDEFTYR
ncbi:MAG: hypothetical protein HC822_08095, partial [Oscillochloris sp.]|nr:hypothetical protein [Oscillochloris sp.]